MRTGDVKKVTQKSNLKNKKHCFDGFKSKQREFKFK